LPKNEFLTHNFSYKQVNQGLYRRGFWPSFQENFDSKEWVKSPPLMTSLKKIHIPQSKNFFSLQTTSLLSLWTALYRFQRQGYARAKPRAIQFFWHEMLETYWTWRVKIYGNEKLASVKSTMKIQSSELHLASKSTK